MKREISWDSEVDLIAVGSSTGGLTAAIVGHDLGMRTILMEASAELGGGTAYSGGIVWIPNNRHLFEAELSDSREEALEYLQRISMGRGSKECMTAFVENGAAAIDYLEKNTPLKMVGMRRMPDYRSALPGGKTDGRILLPDPLGMPPVLAKGEKRFPLLSKVRVCPDIAEYFALRGLPDVPWNQGRTLIGPLVLACLERGIDILVNTRARDLVVEDGRVLGLRAEKEGREIFVRANRGVLLATGGFEWNEEMVKRHMHIPTIYPATPPSNRGDGHVMAMEIGAATALMDQGLWAPAIRINDETHDKRPLYRLIPAATTYAHSIIVNRSGRRFMNESFWPDLSRACVSYNAHSMELTNVPMYYICSQDCRDKHPLGNLPAGTEIADWIHRSNTLRTLAEDLGIDAEGLEQTVHRFNDYAHEGKDPDFGRGSIFIDQCFGDRDIEPNRALGSLDRAPFYGFEILPGVGGHQGGLVTNGYGQVIDVRGAVIPGLYACGNTAAHLAFGAGYNSGGAHAMSLVFGYASARHMDGATRAKAQGGH